MGRKPEEPSTVGEAVIVSGMALVVGCCLFEWLVVSPEHPAHAVLRVLGSGVAASVVMAVLPRR
ncbi:hypothetical protein [Methylobacterium persicinum]|uniref:Uncharacterized protein n=1 Tax=Methylobacterium persicinum TaxID=374426 RepID=A0ABU0HIA6_9HYPH|nr:hypothetical protein [Methylobacterium persicinum]MDQ0442054.1 hypothetical protein [Methylobacterium persicinum]GJE38847.1 hypothetical protein KHHGKMAE_2923 [Methylobacterium persicinum]